VPGDAAPSGGPSWPNWRRSAQSIGSRVASSRGADFVIGHALYYLRQATTSLDEGLANTRSGLKEARIDVMELRRAFDRHRLAGSEGERDITPDVLTTSAYERTSPRVSVITALYNQGGYCIDALESMRASTYTDWELIINDDASTDQSWMTIRDWATQRQDTPLLLLHQPINRGLPRTRNAALQRARGEYVFILDADNMVLPRCLEVLVNALDAAPEAPFAYGILACFEGDRYRALVSHHPWNPGRLRHQNYIDAMALLRTDRLRELGGYTTDRRLYGWEDYDLYCRIAEAGAAPTFVPEVVARYRLGAASMISLTNLSHREAFVALEEHCPTLMFSAPQRF
jgi:GT2 family glycosyltransferase